MTGSPYVDQRPRAYSSTHPDRFTVSELQTASTVRAVLLIVVGGVMALSGAGVGIALLSW